MLNLRNNPSSLKFDPHDNLNRLTVVHLATLNYDYNTAVTPTGDLTINNSEWYDSSYHAVGPADSSYGPPNFTYGPGQPAITGQSPGWLRNDFTGWVGFKFTTASGTPVREMNWTLDPTGNWSAYVTKTNGTTDLDQTRAANTVNEITAIAGTPNWADPTYDAAGNTIAFPKPTDPTQNFTASYDAWNRMVEVDDGSNPVAKYKYDGRGRRIVTLTYTSGALSETRHFYFTDAWQDIEERVGSSGTVDQQYIWGIRYVDELVCRDRTVGDSNERLYAMQDANFNVASICNTSGSVAERYVFNPYGSRTICDASWGVIEASACGWAVGHQGLIHDEGVGLTYDRARQFAPNLGRFLVRDIAYFDGNNLYEYETSNSIAKVDATGLAAGRPPTTQPVHPPITQPVKPPTKGHFPVATEKEGCLTAGETRVRALTEDEGPYARGEFTVEEHGRILRRQLDGSCIDRWRTCRYDIEWTFKKGTRLKERCSETTLMWEAIDSEPAPAETTINKGCGPWTTVYDFWDPPAA